MKGELKRKIAATLKAGVHEEKDLVYFLVEIRKLIDREKYDDENGIIRSFSNWVVHTELTQQRAGTTEVIKDFDVIVKIFKESASPTRFPMHFNLLGLQAYLDRFLRHFKLPTTLVEDEQQWNDFIFLYASVVGDCPIKCTASKEQTEYIQELELVGFPEEGDLKWLVTLKDGETSFFSARYACFEPQLKPKSSQTTITRG